MAMKDGVAGGAVPVAGASIGDVQGVGRAGADGLAVQIGALVVVLGVEPLVHVWRWCMCGMNTPPPWRRRNRTWSLR